MSQGIAEEGKEGGSMAPRGRTARDRAAERDAQRLIELRGKQQARTPRPPADTGNGNGNGTPAGAPAAAASPAPAVTTQAAAPAPAGRGRRAPVHRVDAIIEPKQNKLLPTEVAQGQVAYVADCTGCPWHQANPVAHRVFIADAPVEAVKVGELLSVQHFERHNWWGTWRILAAVTREGEAVKIEGELPSWAAEKKLGIWLVKPAPAGTEQPPAETPAPAVTEPAAETPEDTAPSAAAEGETVTAEDGEGTETPDEPAGTETPASEGTESTPAAEAPEGAEAQPVS